MSSSDGATIFKRVSVLQGELVVAGVFVRIYNEQPSFAVTDPAAFTKGLVTWVHAHAGATLGPEAQKRAQLPAGG